MYLSLLGSQRAPRQRGRLPASLPANEPRGDGPAQASHKLITTPGADRHRPTPSSVHESLQAETGESQQKMRNTGQDEL